MECGNILIRDFSYVRIAYATQRLFHNKKATDLKKMTIENCVCQGDESALVSTQSNQFKFLMLENQGEITFVTHFSYRMN